METTGPQIRAILLPGSVLPAAPAYGALLEALAARLGDRLSAVAQDLEVYAGPTPPPDYTLDTEVDGVLHRALWERYRELEGLPAHLRGL